MFAQVVLGALVAGLDAGRGHTDWPLMGGKFVPEGILAMDPLWRNIVENPAFAQFAHRMAGYVALVAVVVAWLVARASPHAATRRAFGAFALAAIAQVALGIATVLNASPVHLAIGHQIMAMLLWGLALRARYLAANPVTDSIERTVA